MSRPPPRGLRLYEWVREGLLPAPKTIGGRGIIAKWRCRRS
jgi:hypothetical protein